MASRSPSSERVGLGLRNLSPQSLQLAKGYR